MVGVAPLSTMVPFMGHKPMWDNFWEDTGGSM